MFEETKTNSISLFYLQSLHFATFMLKFHVVVDVDMPEAFMSTRNKWSTIHEINDHIIF